MKTSNNQSDKFHTLVLTAIPMEKSDIQVRRKGMRRKNPMCRHPSSLQC